MRLLPHFPFNFLYNIKKAAFIPQWKRLFCPVISVIYPQSESPMAK
ncbi:hypothetical protein U471_18280 [Bacillus amyloliquefaciens CC178]|nr:hypothetical protein U471_18280 [Bacillus amyloliquefaciens CC178]